MARSVRSLTGLVGAAVFALSWIVPARADAPIGAPSMDTVPLLREALDHAPPPDAFEAAVLQNQFELLGFKAAADKLDSYQRLRLLSAAMPAAFKEAATLREVVTGAGVEPALHAAIERISAGGVAVTFPVDADSASAPQPQMSRHGLEQSIA